MSAYRNHRKSFGKLERQDKVIECEKQQGEAEEKESFATAFEADALLDEEVLDEELAALEDAPEEATGGEEEAVYFDNEYAEMPEYAEVMGISFRGAGKMYYFAANGFTAKDGDYAIVETARGMEYGRVVMLNKQVSKKELVLPLKNVIRIADENDAARFAENKKKEEEAFEICQKKILAHELDMKLIDVEYTFDNSKLLFYFTSDDRVDFRDLVKDLASVFKTRIELRQIGIRDEAKLMGGLGVCGRAFCCHSFLGDFVQVSIKMAKEQNLALNSAKISGACGRLMCCLRYEYDTYQEEARRTPKVDSRVVTPDGSGKVTEAKPLLGLVKVQLDETPEEQKVYDRKLLRPETPEEFTKAQERKAIRDAKEAERAEAKAAAAQRVIDAKAAALARATERAEKAAERAAERAERVEKSRGDRNERNTDRNERAERTERPEAKLDRAEKLEKAKANAERHRERMVRQSENQKNLQARNDRADENRAPKEMRAETFENEENIAPIQEASANQGNDNRQKNHRNSRSRYRRPQNRKNSGENKDGGQ